MSFLLDTNVISELVKPAPDLRVQMWLRQRGSDELYLSSITMAELIRGALRLTDKARVERLIDWIDNELTAQFASRILVFDVIAARRWGALMATEDRSGQVLPAADAQIAAIALANDLTLVTRNVKDLSRMTEDIVNPFSSDVD